MIIAAGHVCHICQSTADFDADVVETTEQSCCPIVLLALGRDVSFCDHRCLVGDAFERLSAVHAAHQQFNTSFPYS